MYNTLVKFVAELLRHPVCQVQTYNDFINDSEFINLICLLMINKNWESIVEKTGNYILVKE